MKNGDARANIIIIVQNDDFMWYVVSEYRHIPRFFSPNYDKRLYKFKKILLLYRDIGTPGSGKNCKHFPDSGQYTIWKFQYVDVHHSESSEYFSFCLAGPIKSGLF